jgi:hypothetical protein
LRDIRDLTTLPDPDDPEEMEARHRGLRFTRQGRKIETIKQRRLAARHGYMLPEQAETREEQRLINERLEKLRSGQKKPKSDRPLDQPFIQPLECRICEKVDTPLSHCAECKDSAYCSQQCQIQGCGNKHL